MKDVCLFAHFDKDDRVDDYVLRYLKEIKNLRFSIVFISTSKLPKMETERLQVNCDEIILRPNSGHDFGSWSEGFGRLAENIRGRLLLANDSVYGPIGSLAAAFDQLTAKSADFYGFVESIEREPHLQSWFLLFEPWVVRHPEFDAIFRQPFSAMTKRRVIENGEINLSRRLRGAGFEYEALYSTKRSGLAAQYLPANPTQFLWRELLIQEQIPFLKVELLRDNPFSLEDQKTILSVVESIDFSFGPLIEAHLTRSIRKPPRSRLSRWMNRLLATRVRRGYHRNRADQTIAELWNFVELAPLTVALRVWNLVKSTRIRVS